MNRTVLSFAVAVCLAGGGAAVALAEEHPKGHEHPAGHEHPTGKEHPAKAPAAKEAKPDAKPAKKEPGKQELKKKYTAAVEGFIKDASAKTGDVFTVKDNVLNKEWKLKLDFVHKDKIVSLGGDRYFACADFKSTEKDKTKVDLDFFAKRGEDGKFVVEKVQVHKVAGKARYAYNEKNEQVPAK